MSRILVTGASGFIGSALVSALRAEGLAVRAAYRAPTTDAHGISVDAIEARTDWGAALEGVTQVVHLAGPAHKRANSDAYRREIVEATDALAAQAEAGGVTRFVFTSSVKAMAEHGGPFTERDAPAPQSPYGQAKLEAEHRVLARGALNPVALRAPLVFGPNTKANFAQLLRLADTPWPLPLGGLTNARSLIALETLIAAIAAALRGGPSGAFLVADQPAVSTTELVALVRNGMGRPARLFSPGPLRALLPRALTESLAVDDSAFRGCFAFAPAQGARELLRRCGAAWTTRR